MSEFVPVDLPQYIQQRDFKQQQRYFELMSLILTEWFNSSGFYQPPLTNAQVAKLLTLNPPLLPGTHWYNSDLNKMQFIGAGNTVQTVTSA